MLDAAACDEFDRVDPLRDVRREFAIPRDDRPPHDELVYLCGHSLGLMPRGARGAVETARILGILTRTRSGQRCPRSLVPWQPKWH